MGRPRTRRPERAVRSGHLGRRAGPGRRRRAALRARPIGLAARPAGRRMPRVRSAHGRGKCSGVPAWRNWQTRQTQNLVAARPCGFDPLRRHQTNRTAGASPTGARHLPARSPRAWIVGRRNPRVFKPGVVDAATARRLFEVGMAAPRPWQKIVLPRRPGNRSKPATDGFSRRIGARLALGGSPRRRETRRFRAPAPGAQTSRPGPRPRAWRGIC